jgi:hypothetical protein
MVNSIGAVVFGLVMWATSQDMGQPLPQGIWGFPATVTAMHQDALEVMEVANGSKLKFKLTGQTPLEQVDVKLQDGKPVLTIKAITLADLREQQAISLLVFSDGKEMTLLRAVVSDPIINHMDKGIIGLPA